MNRRNFCLASVVAAISGAGGSQTAPAVSIASVPSVRLYKFIYDHRFSAGRVFGSAAEQIRPAAETAAIGGDITALWSRDLRPQWSIEGGAIAGLTTARTLFCLEQLAKDHWMRVVIRVEHAIAGGHEIVHRLTASPPVMARIASVLAARDWPTRMPAALATCAGAVGAAGVTCVRGSVYRHRLGVADENLVSFVIA